MCTCSGARVPDARLPVGLGHCPLGLAAGELDIYRPPPTVCSMAMATRPRLVARRL